MDQMVSQRRRDRRPEDLMKTSDQISSGDTLERPKPGLSGGTDAGTGSPAGPADIGPADIGIAADPPEHPAAAARDPARLREEISYSAPQPEFTARHRSNDAAPAQRPRRPSRAPLLLSGLAIAVSLVALSGPIAKPWVEKHVSVPPQYAFLLGDGGVAALAARADDTERRVEAVADRVDAIEAVGGNVNVAALRIDRLERAGSSTDSRLGELTARLDAMAARPNIAIKLSNASAYSAGTSTEALAAVVAPILERFGPARCLFGTDYPVARRTMRYHEICDAMRAILASD